MWQPNYNANIFARYESPPGAPMESIAYWLTIFFVGMVLYQVMFGLWFCYVLLSIRTEASENSNWPEASILMALRGADPQLNTSLERILEQDYPAFKLHVIVDSWEDPAYAVVRQAQERYAQRLDLSVLTERRTTCGLQCSAFVQAYQRISETSEVIITVDGDLMPHRTWLKELIEPLLEPGVGASFGNRWFTPRQSTWGSLARYLWNAAAVVPMALLSIPWGGCLAIRRTAFDQSGILDKWTKAIVHDAPIMPALQQLKLRIRFVPGLMMPIHETCSLPFCLDFIKRQMTWTRIYHSGWIPVLLHALVTTAIWILAIGVLVLAMFQQNYRAAGWLMGALAGYVASMLITLSLVELSVRQVLRSRQGSAKWITAATILKLPAALLLTQGVHFVAVLLANSIRQVTWRGVTYSLRGPWDIVLQSDTPYRPTDADASL